MRVATFGLDGRLRGGLDVDRLDALVHAAASLVESLEEGEARPGDVWIANDAAGGPTPLDLTLVEVREDRLKAGRVHAPELARTRRRLGADRFGQGLVVPWLRAFDDEGACADEHALLRANVLSPEQFEERLATAVESLRAAPAEVAPGGAGSLVRAALGRLEDGLRVVELPLDGRLLVDVSDQRLHVRTLDAPPARAGEGCSLELASRAAIERAALVLLAP